MLHQTILLSAANYSEEEHTKIKNWWHAENTLDDILDCSIPHLTKTRNPLASPKTQLYISVPEVSDKDIVCMLQKILYIYIT